VFNFRVFYACGIVPGNNVALRESCPAVGDAEK